LKRKNLVATLPNGAGNTPWIIQNLGNDVVVVKCPGEDDEEVVIRYDGSNQSATLRAVAEIQASEILTQPQKYWTNFWAGYFYAHLFRR
jgi:hypothetical protein